jgi:hypothetical protein
MVLQPFNIGHLYKFQNEIVCHYISQGMKIMKVVYLTLIISIRLIILVNKNISKKRHSISLSALGSGVPHILSTYLVTVSTCFAASPPLPKNQNFSGTL